MGQGNQAIRRESGLIVLILSFRQRYWDWISEQFDGIQSRFETCVVGTSRLYRTRSHGRADGKASCQPRIQSSHP